VNFTCAACEPTNNNGCGPLSEKVGCPSSKGRKRLSVTEQRAEQSTISKGSQKEKDNGDKTGNVLCKCQYNSLQFIIPFFPSVYEIQFKV
jgi:hypothetical protein